MEESAVSQTEVQPTEPLKGHYGTLEDAFGSDWNLIHNPETSFAANPQGLYEGDKLLCANWQGAEIRHYQDESKHSRTYIHRELEDGRSVHIIVSLGGTEPNLTKNSETQLYRVEKLIFTGASGVDCVNFCEAELPEGVSVTMKIGNFDFEDGTRLKSDSHMAFRLKAKQIVFNTIDKVLDIGSLAHERGHAVSCCQQGNEEEQDLQSSAYMLMKEGKKHFQQGNFSAIELLEAKYKLDYQSARYIVAREEQKASLLGLKWLEKYQKPLRINAELMAKIDEDNERALITYDAPFLPDASVASKVAKQVDEEKAEVIWEHLNLYGDILYWLREHHLDEGESLDIFLNTGKATVAFEPGSGGWIRFNFDPYKPDEENTVIAIISPILSAITVTKSIGEGWTDYILDISSPEKFIERLSGVKDVVEKEEDIVRILIYGLIKREEEARDKCEWLKAIFKSNYPGIEQLDPFTVAEQVLSGKVKGALAKTDQITQLEYALQQINPLSRWDQLCLSLGNRFLRFFEGTADTYHFDPQTGRRLTDSFDKLVTICRDKLSAIFPPEKIPDRYLSTNLAETNLRILELAAQNFHQLTDNRYLPNPNTSI